MTQYFCHILKNKEVKISKEKPKEFEHLLKSKSFIAPRDEIAKAVYLTHLKTMETK